MKLLIMQISPASVYFLTIYNKIWNIEAAAI
jgi:hypothetical protein